jgi:type IVB pilus formation R64 PilN family outer membrane protein
MKKVVISLTALSVALSGCSDMISVKQDVDKDIKDTTAKYEKSMASMPANQSAESRLLFTTVTPGSWIGVNKVTPKFDAHLPDVFNKDVTLVFPDRANISTVAERLAKVTGLPVKLRPDVFMKASALVPQSASGGTEKQTTPLTPSAPQGIVASTTTQDYRLDMTLNYTGPLTGLLDSMVAKAGLNWEYKDGAIVIYRLVTKTFTIKSTPGSSELTESIGKTGGTQTGSTGSSSGNSGGSSTFQSDANVKMGSKFSIWDNLKESINAMLTPVGKVAVTEAMGTITVTDTREVVDQVETMVNQINKSLSRQVAFRVEVLSVDTSKTASYGVDWSAVFSKVTNTLDKSWSLSFASPTSVASSDAASIGYSILTPSGSNNTRSALSGSQAMVAALNQVGPTNVVTTAAAVTLNRQPVPVAITDQTGYVASVSAEAATSATTSSSTNSNTLVQINPGTVTTGFILNLLPSVTDDNSVLLQFSIDISTLKALTTFGTGQLAVQSPEVTAMQFMQRVGMKNGETLVLSGFERNAGQYNRNTLTENSDLLMGGSINGQKTREAIVILITPVITEGV